MAETTEDLKAEMQTIMDREVQRGLEAGKVEGALNVLFALDLDKDKRTKLFSKATGLDKESTTAIIENRELEVKIKKSKSISKEDKAALSALIANKALMSNDEIRHPSQTLAFIAALGGGKLIRESLPQVEEWVENGEKVTMCRVREWILQKYGLL